MNVKNTIKILSLPKWSLHSGQMMSAFHLQNALLIPASVLLLSFDLNNLSPTLLSNPN